MCRVVWALVWRPMALLVAAVPAVLFAVSTASALPMSEAGEDETAPAWRHLGWKDDGDGAGRHPLGYYDPIHAHLLDDWPRNRRTEEPDNGYEKLWALRQELNALKGSGPPHEVVFLEVMNALDRAAAQSIAPGDLHLFVHREVLVALPQLSGSAVEKQINELIDAQVAALGDTPVQTPGSPPIFAPDMPDTVVPVPASGFLTLSLIAVALLGQRRLRRLQAGAGL